MNPKKTEQTPVQFDFPRAFQGLFVPARYKVYYGGRGGAKSWAVTEALPIKGMQRKIRVLCAREFQTSIADSVHKLLGERIEAMGLSSFYEVQKTRIIGANGTEFIFKGLRHNIQEIKSTEGIDICWCFVADTLIDGKPIQSIRVGDKVKSFNHKTGQIEYRTVLKTMKRPAPKHLYALTSVGSNSIICTGEHPIYVEGKGYVQAKQIAKGDVLCAEETRYPRKSSLFGWMWGLDRNKHTWPPSEICKTGWYLLFGLCQKATVRKNEKKQSHEQPCVQRKNDKFTQKSRNQTPRFGWQWSRLFQGTKEVVESAWTWMVGGVYSPHGATRGWNRTANALQNRLGKFLLWHCDRNRRGQPYRDPSETRGREKNKILTRQRVESVEIQEQGSIKQLQLSDGGNFVYNLEIEGNNNYFANGILVHNCEEAQSVSEESWSVLIPTIRGKGSEIWVTFNPIEDTDPTYQRFVVNPPPNSIVKKVSWFDNPWFPDVLRQEMEYLKRVDFDAYRHVWEGETKSISDAVIFRGKVEVRAFETPEDIQRFYFGADWGFSQDPTVLVRAFVVDNTLFVDHEAYGIGVDIDKTPDLFDKVPEARKWAVYADCARPETISYMKRKGFNITGATKWGGSVEDGIAFLRSFEKIVVHERCKHTAEEFRLYKYKVDQKTGDVLPIIVDANNHAIDSLRYALSKLIRNKRNPAKVLSFTGGEIE